MNRMVTEVSVEIVRNRKLQYLRHKSDVLSILQYSALLVILKNLYPQKYPQNESIDLFYFLHPDTRDPRKTYILKLLFLLCVVRHVII